MEVVLIDDEEFTITAKALVRAEIINTWEESWDSIDGAKPLKFTVKVVWACKTLQNWKAFVISDMEDQLMYEVTYNGDKKETYIDTYRKQKQTVVRDGD